MLLIFLQIRIPQPQPEQAQPQVETVAFPSSSINYRPLCVKCNLTTKTKRKTRFQCGTCGNAMCLQHGKETKSYLCDDCLME